MFRKVVFSLALGIAALATSASSSQVQAAPIDDFREFAYQGVVYSYYGYAYANYARQIAISNGYTDDQTGYALYYGELYSYYAYLYGYYGLEAEFSSYIQNADDLSNAAWNYEYGIYNYAVNSIYPQSPNVSVIFEPTYYAFVFNYYAEVYYAAAFDAVN